MSQQINEIISKNKKLFLDREEDFQQFLTKNYEKAFQDLELINLERVDETERIQKAGFQKALSSWRNIYKNIVVSSCLEIDNEQKRYDYKFYFIEEKLDEVLIQKIEDTLKEVSALKRNFKFADASAKVDELLDLIKNEQDRVFNKRLFNEKREIIAAERDYNTLSKRLKELEEDIKKETELGNLKLVIQDCEELIGIAKALRNGPLTRKYTELLEKSKKELEVANELYKLEREFNYNNLRKNFNVSIVTCEKIIELSKENKKEKTEQKYTRKLKENQGEISKIKQKVERALIIAERLMEAEEFEMGISRIDNSLKDLEGIKYKEFDNYEERLRQKRNEIIGAQEKALKLSSDMTELDKKLFEKLEEGKFFDARDYCERLVEVSKEANNDELVKKYIVIKKELKDKIENIVKDIEKILDESDDLIKLFKYEEALSEIDSILSTIGQNLPDYRKRLIEKKKLIQNSEEEYKLFEDQIIELDKILNIHHNNENYVTSLVICQNLVELSRLSKNPKYIEKYNKLLVNFQENIKRVKELVGALIEVGYNLSKNHRFKEALAKLDTATILMGEQDLPDEKKQLNIARARIQEEQEDFIQFSGDIEQLEKQLENNLNENDLMAALSDCDLLIQLAEAYNQPELIEKFTNIFEEISAKVEEIKNKVDRAIQKPGKLTSKSQFENALLNIDKVLEFLETQKFPEFKQKLELNRRDIVAAKQNYEESMGQIEDLDTHLRKFLEDNNYVAALMTCDLIHDIAKANKYQDFSKKYHRLLNEISSKIKEIKRNINKLMNDSTHLSTEHQFEAAFSKIEKAKEFIGMQDLPKYKSRLEDKRKVIINAQKMHQERLHNIQNLDGKLEIHLKNNDLISGLEDCESLIQLGESYTFSEVVIKYSIVLKDINDKIAEIKNRIEQIIKESDELCNNLQFKGAIANLDSMLDSIQNQRMPLYKTQLEIKKQEIIDSARKYEEFQQEIKRIENQIESLIQKKDIESALNSVSSLFQIAQDYKEPDLIEQYAKILKEIDEKVEELKNKIEGVVRKGATIHEGESMKEGFSNIDIILSQIRDQELPEYQLIIEEKKEEEKREKFKEATIEIDEELGVNLLNEKYKVALDNCNSLILLSEKYEQPKQTIKYLEMIEEIENRIEEIKEDVENAIYESKDLSNELKFEEALSSIDSLLLLVKKQELPKEEKRLIGNRKDIIRSEDRYSDFESDLKLLDNKIGMLIENDDIEIALDNFETFLKITEPYKEPNLVMQYTKILEEIDGKIEEIKKNLETVLSEKSNQADKQEFNNALSKLDSMLEFIRAQELPEQQKIIEQNLKSIENEREERRFERERIRKERQEDIKRRIQELQREKKAQEELEKQSEIEREKQRKEIEESKKKIGTIQILEEKEKSKLKALPAKKTPKKEPLAKIKLPIEEKIQKPVKEKTTADKKAKKDAPKKKPIKETPLIKIVEKIAEETPKPKRRYNRIIVYSPYVKKTPIRRLMKDNGAKIVAAEALQTLLDWMTTSTEKITKLSIRFSNHAKRKKIIKEDIRMAIKYRK